jgi:hypothetical protein
MGARHAVGIGSVSAMPSLVAIDHLVYATPDVATSAAELTAWLGVTPVAGGRHVGIGTRNELLGLGGGSYLEIIGPDLDQPRPSQPRPFGLDDLARPMLVTWAARATDLAAATAAARVVGYDPGDARGMQRVRPDGVVLSWRLTTTTDDGVLPFLIDWGVTSHPSQSAPTGVELLALELTRPAPALARRVLEAWGLAGVTVTEGFPPSVRAVLRGPGGTLVLA